MLSGMQNNFLKELSKLSLKQDFINLFSLLQISNSDEKLIALWESNDELPAFVNEQAFELPKLLFLAYKNTNYDFFKLLVNEIKDPTLLKEMLEEIKKPSKTGF